MAEMHQNQLDPQANKFHRGNGDDGKHYWDLRDRFPLVTAKETRWRTAFLEMLFFLAGQTNVKWLEDRGSKLWTPWANKDGDLGPVYGAVWPGFAKPTTLHHSCHVALIQDDPS